MPKSNVAKTTASVYDDDLDRLHDRKGRRESIADVVSRLLDESDDSEDE